MIFRFIIYLSYVYLVLSHVCVMKALYPMTINYLLFINYLTFDLALTEAGNWTIVRKQRRDYVK